MKWIKTIANLGYGSRKLVEKLLHDGHITDSNGEPINDASKLGADAAQTGWLYLLDA